MAEKEQRGSGAASPREYNIRGSPVMRSTYTPGPGAYNLTDTMSASGKAYSFGAQMNDELKIKLGYNPLRS